MSEPLFEKTISYEEFYDISSVNEMIDLWKDIKFELDSIQHESEIFDVDNDCITIMCY